MNIVLISVEKTESRVVGVGPMEYVADKNIGIVTTGVTALLEQLDITDVSLSQV